MHRPARLSLAAFSHYAAVAGQVPRRYQCMLLVQLRGRDTCELIPATTGDEPPCLNVLTLITLMSCHLNLLLA